MCCAPPALNRAGLPVYIMFEHPSKGKEYSDLLLAILGTVNLRPANFESRWLATVRRWLRCKTGGLDSTMLLKRPF